MDKKENTQNNTDSSKIDPVTEGNQTASTISDENSADGVVFDKKSTIITPTKKDKVIQPTPTIPTKETDIGELNIADEEKIKTINLNSGEIEGVENIVPPIKSEQEVQKVIDVTEEGIVESTESVNKKLSEEQNPKEKISNIFSEKKPAEGELKKETHENTTINKADRTEETPLKTVRTFKEDIAKALKESKASITGIALAGKTKRSKEKTTPTKKKSTNRSLLFGFGAVVVAFLIASGIFFFLYK